jgi:hypothetical protein
MTEAKIKYFEQLIATYTDNIRASDFKSNILIFFLSISISAVTSFRGELPRLLPILILLIFPLSAIILLILAIYPGFRVVSGYSFLVHSSVGLDDILEPPEDEHAIVLQLRHRCVALANILYRKIALFKVSMVICLVYLFALLLLAACGGVLALGR